MKLVLDVQDSKAAFIVELLQNFPYVTFEKQPSKGVKKAKKIEAEEYIEPTKEEILQNIKTGLEEVKLYQEGKINLTNARDFLNELRSHNS
jgi:hypothetical protein